MKLFGQKIKFTLPFLASFIWFSGLSQNLDDTRLEKVQNQVEGHIEFLASESLYGRSTLTGHDTLAAAYLDSVFFDFGLTAAFSNNDKSYLQPFIITLTKPGNRTLEIPGKNYEYGKDFISLGANPQTDKELEVVFGGIGSYDNIDTLDIKGKALLILTNNLRVAGLKIQELAREKGCLAIIAANPLDLNQFESLSRQFYSKQNKMKVDVAGIEEKSITRYFSRFGVPIPRVIISNDLAENILGENPKKILKKIKDEEEVKSPPKEFKILFDYSQQIDSISTSNVIGIIRSERKTEQNVMICAHYDHLEPEGDRWYPGADDNASGIAILLEVARLLANDYQKGYRPNRNIVFSAFTAEEIGLLGSHFYSHNPVFPVDSMKLVLNFDMAGRMGLQEKKGNNLYVWGNNDIDDFFKTINSINSDTTLVIDPKSIADISLFSLSDHHHFDKKGIPAYLLTTGLHADYHQPTDIPEKLSYENMVRIVKLTYNTIRHYADKE